MHNESGSVEDENKTNSMADSFKTSSHSQLTMIASSPSSHSDTNCDNNKQDKALIKVYLINGNYNLVKCDATDVDGIIRLLTSRLSPQVAPRPLQAIYSLRLTNLETSEYVWIQRDDIIFNVTEMYSSQEWK
jgi:hypothetical protein